MSDPTPTFIEPVGDDYDEDDNSRPKAKITAKGAAMVGVRAVGGTIGIGVAAAAILAAVFLPIPTITHAPNPVAVVPVPTAQELVCPGGILRLGDDSGQAATTASAIGPATVRYDSTAGEITSTPFEASDAATGGTSSAPLLLSSPVGASTGDALLVAGAQSQVADGAEFAGFASTDCAGVATETWLVGGATTVGRTTLVTLANPSDTTSNVSLTISAENGSISAPGATGIVVQPHGQRVIPLAGFAPDVESPVVHVVSRGGQIVANLQQATVRGLDAGGVDIIGASEAPATSQTIPGVVIAGRADLESRLGEDGYADLATVLRVFAPGTTDTSTSVRVSVIPDNGGTDGASFSFDLDAGMVNDLTLDNLVDGSYTVRVDSPEPIVAGVRVSTVAASVLDASSDPAVGASDFAWISSTDELSDDALVTVAPGPHPQLHFFNPTTADATVSLAAIDGKDLTLAVPAGASASIDVVGGVTYSVGRFTQLYGSVSYSGNAQIAGYAVQPPAVGSGAITIYP